jgi:subtilase family serine protease
MIKSVAVVLSAMLLLAGCANQSVVPSNSQALGAANALAGASGPRNAMGVPAISGLTGFDALRAMIAAQPPRSVAVCPEAARPGYARCFSHMRTDIGGPTHRMAAAPDYHAFYVSDCQQGLAVCYKPADLWKAYSLTSFVKSKGKGVTVGIVDFMDDPKAESDLGVYRKGFGLPACTTANGCFKKVGETGTSKLPAPNTDDAGETSLDVDMVSAICPLCHIVLVETNTSSFKDIDVAEVTAARLKATIISNSFGGPEGEGSDPAFATAGVLHVASAGDTGFDNCAGKSGCTGPNMPASFASVVAVGGTTMLPDTKFKRGFIEVTWNCYDDEYNYGDPGACSISTIFATGSGCSAKAAKPAWQHDGGCPRRTYNDVSAVADLVTGVYVYDSYAGGLTVFGGTSVASPIISAVYALAGNATKTHAGEELWEHRTAGLNDIVYGTNEIPGGATCPPAGKYVCFAQGGYDGPTGWGTPSGLSAF